MENKEYDIWIPLFFGSIVYNQAIVYKRWNFLNIVYMIVIDQCNQIAYKTKSNYSCCCDASVQV